jgi:hypothetical protein
MESWLAERNRPAYTDVICEAGDDFGGSGKKGKKKGKGRKGKLSAVAEQLGVR